jgi:hypothetical protein
LLQNDWEQFCQRAFHDYGMDLLIFAIVAAHVGLFARWWRGKGGSQGILLLGSSVLTLGLIWLGMVPRLGALILEPWREAGEALIAYALMMVVALVGYRGGSTPAPA